MTCVWHHCNCYSSCDFRLTFGLPLEDVFPYGDVHPSLKRLFYVAHLYFHQENTPSIIKCLTSKSSHCSRLPNLSVLIDALTFGRPFPSALTFEMLIGALRQFLGALPVPLMPKYTDRNHFDWKQLSSDCKLIVEQRFKANRDEDALVEKLTNDLLRLPRVNLLLIAYFVHFLRCLVFYGKSGNGFNKKAAKILINYFAASVFTRPTCSASGKSGTIYHPLMLMLIIKWPRIQEKCISKEPRCFQPEKTYVPTLLRFPSSETVDTNDAKLSTIAEGSEGDETISRYTKMNTKSTVTDLSSSVSTQIIKSPKISTGMQTASSETTSKRTSTVSLKAYAQNNGLLSSETLISSSRGSRSSRVSKSSRTPEMRKTSSMFDCFSEVLKEFGHSLQRSGASLVATSDGSLTRSLPKTSEFPSKLAVNSEQDLRGKLPEVHEFGKTFKRKKRCSGSFPPMPKEFNSDESLRKNLPRITEFPSALNPKYNFSGNSKPNLSKASDIVQKVNSQESLAPNLPEFSEFNPKVDGKRSSEESLMTTLPGVDEFHQKSREEAKLNGNCQESLSEVLNIEMFDDCEKGDADALLEVECADTKRSKDELNTSLRSAERSEQDMRKAPSCVNLTDFDDDYDTLRNKHNATEPLYGQCKSRKTFLRFSRQVTGMALLKQFKSLRLVKRARSEESVQQRERGKYEKLTVQTTL